MMSSSYMTAVSTALRSLGVLVLCVSVFALSCVREGGGPEWPVRAGEIRIEYSVDGEENVTRSVTATAAERLLKDVHVMFFNSDGTFIACQKADVTAGTSFFSFPVPDGITEGVAYKTLIVGNASSWLPSASSTFADYLETLPSKGYKNISDNLAAVSSGMIDAGKGLPMWGEVYSSFGGASDFVLHKNNTGSYYFNGHIVFYRAVCRLDLTNKVADKLVITRVKVCNYRAGAYYFLQNVPYGNVTSAVDSGDGWVTVDAPSGSAQSVTAKLYAFPNTVSVVSQNDDQTTYLMIAGKYNGSTTETYYRFNMAANGAKQLLQSNHCYTGVISNVTGAGSDTPGGAKDATIPMFEYNVSDWYGNDDIGGGGTQGGISISPKPPVGGFVIEAFDTSRAIIANGIVCSKKITVSIPETTDDYTISVKSSFDPKLILFLSKYPQSVVYSDIYATYGWEDKEFYTYIYGNHKLVYELADELNNLQNNDDFYLNVFRSSPGERDIVGNIEIKVKSKVGDTDGTSLQIPVTIKSSGVVADDVFFKRKDGSYIMIADRNIGAPQRFVGSNINRGEYYSKYDTGISNLVSGVQDSLNISWSGIDISVNNGRLSSANLDSICVKWISEAITEGPLYEKEDASKWRALSYGDMQELWNYFMMGHNRCYLLSPYKNKSGNYVACFFPNNRRDKYSSTHYLLYNNSNSSTYNYSVAYTNGSLFSARSTLSNPGIFNTTNNNTSIYFYLGNYDVGFYRLRCVRNLTYDEFARYVDNPL